MVRLSSIFGRHNVHYQSGWNQVPSKQQVVTSISNTATTLQTDNYLSQISIKLSGKLAQAPVSNPDGKFGRVELTFQTARGFEPLATTNFQNGPQMTVTERVLVWCNDRQFARFAAQIGPQTRFEVQGKPLAISDKAGKPQLVILCSSIKAINTGSFGMLSSNKARLACSWAIIFGAIFILQILLPRLILPGLLPLAIVLGAMRFVEQLEFAPDQLKLAIRRYMVKILLFAAFVAAIWFFVQFGYYTTARFR